MELRIPAEKFTKSYDAMVESAPRFNVDLVQNANNTVEILGNDDDVFDFLVAYHDFDVNAAKEDISQYTKPKMLNMTPEIALQMINEFVIAHGGFEQYDSAFEALNNAIHGAL